jgi:hypothetical protein
MHPAIEQRIREMIDPASPGAEQQVRDVLAGWERLFQSLGLDEEQQQAEFDFIMRARHQPDVMAVVAPDVWRGPTPGAKVRGH